MESETNSEARGKTWDRGGGDVRLHKATNTAQLKKLLIEVTDHDTLDSNGDAPLHYFVKRKDKEKFKCLMTFLIYSKCDINMLNVDGQTALHLACQDNDVQATKTLIAFDAKINAVSVDKKTPLDIVLQHPGGSSSDELENLLFLLGALRYQEISTSISDAEVGGNDPDVQNGSGTATATVAETEDDVFMADPVSEREHERRQPRQTLTPGLPTLPEKGPGEEDEPIRHSVIPNSSSEMGLNSLVTKMANYHLQQTTVLSSDSSSGSSEPALLKLKKAQEKTQSSFEASSEAAATTGIEKVDGHPPKKQELLWRSKAQTSPDLLSRFEVTRPAGHGDGKHVRFSEQRRTVAGDQHRREVAARRRNIFRRQNSGICLKSISEYNPEMKVMHSLIGESVVPSTPQTRKGNTILCLDGGGLKGLIQIEILKTIEQMTGKSISELFDWVVATSTGAVLALLMFYSEQPLEEAKRMFFSGIKDTVFKRQSKFISYICDTKAFEDLLKGWLGTEKTMDSVKKPNILVAAVNKSTTSLPLVFFNNCLDNEYSNKLVWKVARYTSAAPVFFAECDNYVDGGIKANNPTTYGLAEIQNFLDNKHGRGSPDAKISCVVSVGCGVYPPEPLGNTDIADALKMKNLHKLPSRLKELLNLLTTALTSSEEVSRLCHINCEHQGIPYFRFSPEIGEDIGLTEVDNRKLFEIIIRAKQIFKENAEQVESMIKQLGSKIRENYLHDI